MTPSTKHMEVTYGLMDHDSKIGTIRNLSSIIVMAIK